MPVYQTTARGLTGEPVAPTSFKGVQTRSKLYWAGGREFVEGEILDDVDASPRQQDQVSRHEAPEFGIF